MPIELKPETEALIRKDVKRGPYENAADYVDHAVAMLHEKEEWLAENRAEITAKIEAGYASARRGDLVDEEQVRVRMAERKRIWLAQPLRSLPRYRSYVIVYDPKTQPLPIVRLLHGARTRP